MRMITIDELRQFGANTDEGVARCMGNEEFYSIPANPMTVTDDSITYYIQLDEYTSNIEFRFIITRLRHL